MLGVVKMLNGNGGVVKAPWAHALQGLAQFIKDVGFPTFVAIYVLTRLEPLLARINTSISELTQVIAILSERMR